MPSPGPDLPSKHWTSIQDDLPPSAKTSFFLDYALIQLPVQVVVPLEVGGTAKSPYRIAYHPRISIPPLRLRVMDAKQIQARASAISKAASEGVPSAALTQLLEPLRHTSMSEEILRSSKIGVIVNKLRQNKDPAVGRLAGELVGKWKKDVDKAKGLDSKHAAKVPPAVKSTNGTVSPAPSPVPLKAKPKSSVPSDKRNAEADGIKVEQTGNKTRDSCLKLMYNGLAFMSEECEYQLSGSPRITDILKFSSSP